MFKTSSGTKGNTRRSAKPLTISLCKREYSGVRTRVYIHRADVLRTSETNDEDRDIPKWEVKKCIT